LIRFIARHFFEAPDRASVRVLEIGCGAGANLWFLAREGFQAYGIDGSETAIAQAESRLKEDGLTADLAVGDVMDIADHFPGVRFDAVIDVGCLVCNRVGAVDKILDRVDGALEPGGRVFSMLLARGTYGDGLGTEQESGTFTDISEGPLSGIGLCHFFTLDEIQTLFGRFSDLAVERSVRTMDNQRHEVKHWVVQGSKPS
jgi:SAM-dependent methyltransferase